MSPSERELFSVIFVSIDPHRDTPEVLARFLHYFNDDFIGVTADDEILNDFTRQLGVTYTRSETIDKQSEDNYLMDHSSRILMINPHAELQAYLRSPRSPQSLLESVRQTQDYFDRIESHK